MPEARRNPLDAGHFLQDNKIGSGRMIVDELDGICESLADFLRQRQSNPSCDKEVRLAPQPRDTHPWGANYRRRPDQLEPALDELLSGTADLAGVARCIYE